MTKHLITSALQYIYGIKHLGNLVGSMLPADVYARYLRQRGEEVLFICGTDDFGTPAELGAAKAKMPPKEFCDMRYLQQKEIYESFNLNFDHFGRSSCKENIELTQQFGQKLLENGFAEIRSMTQIYSNVDKRYLPDRYVEGTCPHCGSDKARGDQCEECTKLLDPTDLLNPRSAISGSTDLETRETKHLFLLQSKLQNEIRAWIDSKDWPKVVSSIAYKWLDEGLQDRCITRDLDWGVPVTGIDGLEGKVYYVWFDAPIGYLGITKEWASQDSENRDWKSWWYDTKNIELTQFMAKDNIPFHSVLFPAAIFGLKEPWKKVDYLKGFNWLTYEGGKFSTSQQIGVFTDDALKEYPADYWRYYLMSRVPEKDDSSFTWEDFQTLVNKDLADVLGNFVSRVLKFSEKRFGNQIPANVVFSENENELVAELKTLLEEYQTHMQNKEFRKATFALRQIWALGNEYIAKAEPWFVIKEDEQRAAEILSTAINIARIFAIVSSSVIPHTAQKLADALNLDVDVSKVWVDSNNLKEELSTLTKGHEFTVPENLFAKIDDARRDELKAKYSGK
ncbi:MAG: methionine--tRNA ligase [Proteobacteria bacterium]|nr:methionine--tRNA ligase [Pseudomonadota bacterium]